MCYSKEVSIITYGIGTVTSIMLYKRNNISLKINGILFLFVTQMQLIDYFIWKNNKCNKFNLDVSHIGTILNHFQPVILYIAIKYFNKKLDDKRKIILDAVFVIYLASLLHYSKGIYPLACTEVTPESDPYLKWDWNYKKNASFYLIFMAVIVLFQYIGLEKPYNIFITLAIIISIIGTKMITKDKKAFGLMWCWFSAFLPLILIILDMYKEKYDKKLNINIL